MPWWEPVSKVDLAHPHAQVLGTDLRFDGDGFDRERRAGGGVAAPGLLGQAHDAFAQFSGVTLGHGGLNLSKALGRPHPRAASKSSP